MWAVAPFSSHPNIPWCGAEAREGRFFLASRPVPQAARGRYQLGVTLRFVYGLIASGDLPSVLLSPRARRIRQTDLDAFLAARRQGGEAA